MGIEKIVGAVLWAVSIMGASLQGASLRDTVASQPGFEYFYNLEYEQALAIFTEHASGDPSSADNYNHIAQTILYREMYRAGMLSSDFIGGTKFVHQPKLPLSDEDKKQFQEALAHAITLSQERLAANPNDTAALASIGRSYGRRGHYCVVVHQ